MPWGPRPGQERTAPGPAQPGDGGRRDRVLEAKYHYVFWRPVSPPARGHRRQCDGPDPSWLPLFATPPFPGVGHSTVSGAAAAVLGEFLRQKATSELRILIRRLGGPLPELLGGSRRGRRTPASSPASTSCSACVDGQVVGVGRRIRPRPGCCHWVTTTTTTTDHATSPSSTRHGLLPARKVDQHDVGVLSVTIEEDLLAIRGETSKLLINAAGSASSTGAVDPSPGRAIGSSAATRRPG